MGTNRCSSRCDCGYQFNLGSFRGQPIEFRKYRDYAPLMGAKLICPDCGKVYFGWIKNDFEFWDEQSKESFDKDTNTVLGRKYENPYKGKFAKRTNNGVVQLGYNQIDTAYYESFNDDAEGIDRPNPYGLFMEDTDPLTDWTH